MKAFLIPTAVAMSIGLTTAVSAATDAPAGASLVSDNPECSPRVQAIEIEKTASTLFNKLDTDSDGFVTEGEYVAMCMPTTSNPDRRPIFARAARHNFASLNPDDNGILTLSEYRMAIGAIGSEKGKMMEQAEGKVAEAKLMVSGVSANDLIGQYVVNRNDQILGRIDNVVVSPNTDNDFLVIEVNDLLRTDAEYLVLDLDRLQLVRKMSPVLVVHKSVDAADIVKNLPEYDESKFEDSMPDKSLVMERMDIRSKEDRLQVQ